MERLLNGKCYYIEQESYQRNRKLHQFVLNMQENLIKKAIDVDRKDFAKKVDLAEKRQGQIN